MSNPAPTATKKKLLITPKDKSDIQTAKLRAALARPWYAPLIRQLRLVRNDDLVSTMGVDNAGVVYYNLQFVRDTVAKDGIAGLAFVIWHEGMHLLTRTFERRAFIGKLDDPKVHHDFNIAADITINELGLKEFSGEDVKIKLTMPEGGATAAKLNLPPGLSAEDYYLLVREKNIQPPPTPMACNGCGVSPSDGQQPAMTTARLNAIKNEMKAAQKAAGREKGDGWLGSLLDVEVPDPPRIDWRNQLRHVSLWIVNMVAGDDENTYTKKNLRQFDGFDDPILPGHCSFEPKIVVIADTSGSMGGDLQKILGEVQALVAIAGPVTFIACDAAVHAESTVSNLQDIKNNLKGGGGTDMNPAFQAAKKLKPSLIVCVTDGAIGHTESVGIKTVWCLVHDYKHDVQASVDAGWGTIVECW